ncbi:MarR family winged helix-turn-helix transcriptional regulator [Embleya sp. NPDC050493]|uniref:MarR family winged helix-turn-helix transcriptional regulator n=1 Tax=Embleya sp. NPDC050493 TaxID=3363989 RepID=UPI0037915449
MSDDRAVHRIEAFVGQVADMARLPGYRNRLLAVAGVELHQSGLSILSVLEREGPLGISELGVRLGVDQSTASRQVRPLEAAGLVARDPDPADRRASLLRVTEAGLRLRARVRDTWLADIAWAVRDWDPAEREQLGELLERFAARWREAAAGAGLDAAPRIDRTPTDEQVTS